MATFHNPVRESPLRRPQGRVPKSLWLAGLAVFTVGALAAFYELSSDQAISIIVAGSVFFVLMALVVSASATAELRSRNLVFALWWVLLGSEEVFSYMTEDAEGGQVSSGAYSEAMIWVFVIFVFLLYSYRHHRYLHFIHRTVQVGVVVRRHVFGVLRLCRAARVFAGLDHQAFPGDPAAGGVQLRN